jgi:hypothetical protein
MTDFELPESNSIIDALQARIDVLEARLAAIHGAASLLMAGLPLTSDEITEVRVAFIFLESGKEPVTGGEECAPVKYFLNGLGEVTHGKS